MISSFMIDMFPLCITPCTKIFNNTLHYLSFSVFLYFIFQKSKEDKIK
jgi:hypothetical protein